MTKTRVLVVDDEEDILELVRYNLISAGFDVDCAATGEKALRMVQANPPDAVVLDLMLPGTDGLTVARVLKEGEATRPVPIIMRTAKGEESDVITGLEIGADDYVTKPFSPRVLIARINAVLRRRRQNPPAEDEILRIHDLSIDPMRRVIRIQNEAVDLTFTEFQVIHFLAKRPGWVFTRSQIVDAVRGENYPVTDRSVDVQIVGLRKKLGDHGKYIETVRGVGYRFSETP